MNFKCCFKKCIDPNSLQYITVFSYIVYELLYLFICLFTRHNVGIRRRDDLKYYTHHKRKLIQDDIIEIHQLRIEIQRYRVSRRRYKCWNRISKSNTEKKNTETLRSKRTFQRLKQRFFIFGRLESHFLCYKAH